MGKAMGRRKKISVGPNDVVIVLHDDGTFEAALPDQVGDPLPDHLITSAALVYALRNPEMIAILHKNFALECHNIKDYQ